MELDDHFKQLVEELGSAINESLSQSDRIAEIMGRIRASGYDLFLVLEMTIGFDRHRKPNATHRGKLAGSAPAEEGAFRLTRQDAQFLRGLKIKVDESVK